MAPYSEELEVKPYIDITKINGMKEFVRVKKEHPTYKKKYIQRICQSMVQSRSG